jgi:hypothetical protein
MELLRQEATERIQMDLDVTKIDHMEEANKLLAPYTEGWCDVVDMLIKIKHLQKILEFAEISIKDAAVDHLAVNGKIIEKNGIKMSYRVGSAKADFSDVDYVNDLQNKLKAAKEISKQLAKSKQSEMADTETGELITACKFVTEKDTLTINYL